MTAFSVLLLADVPELVPAVGRIRWTEWGRPPEPVDPHWWIDTTRREAGRDELPITFVAVDPSGTAAGAVGLGEFDIAERRDCSPWVLGMVVRADRRGAGVGRLLLARVGEWANEHQNGVLWVATGGSAVDFYRRCGWRVVETLRQASGEHVTILRREPRPS